ncbi:MAG: hypothetical protein ACYCZN_11815 [Candidatus Dormibacteria bacterium]
MRGLGLDPKSLGLVSVVLAALVEIIQGVGLYSGIVFLWPVVFSHGGGFRAVSLALFFTLLGLAVDLIAAGLGMAGGCLMYQGSRKGPPLVFSALLAGVIGETLLGFGGLGDYAFTSAMFPGSLFWIVLLVLGTGVLWTSLYKFKGHPLQ